MTCNNKSSLHPITKRVLYGPCLFTLWLENNTCLLLPIYVCRFVSINMILGFSLYFDYLFFLISFVLVGASLFLPCSMLCSYHAATLCSMLCSTPRATLSLFPCLCHLCSWSVHPCSLHWWTAGVMMSEQEPALWERLKGFNSYFVPKKSMIYGWVKFNKKHGDQYVTLLKCKIFDWWFFIWLKILYICKDQVSYGSWEIHHGQRWDEKTPPSQKLSQWRDSDRKWSNNILGCLGSMGSVGRWMLHIMREENTINRGTKNRLLKAMKMV